VMLTYAAQLNINLNTFSQCLADEGVKGRVFAEKEEGQKLKVNATPTFFLGEQRFVGGEKLKEDGEPVIRKKLGLPEASETAPPKAV